MFTRMAPFLFIRLSEDRLYRAACVDWSVEKHVDCERERSGV